MKVKIDGRTYDTTKAERIKEESQWKTRTSTER